MGLEIVERLENRFREVMGDEPEVVCFAPGRVNLIGEHIDYNGGHVLPCALSLGTYGALKKRSDDLIRLFSSDFEKAGVIETNLDAIDGHPDVGWGRYVLGVVWAFREQGYDISSGFDFVCAGDLPAKAGLSSSASLEVMTGAGLRALYGIGNAGHKNDNDETGVRGSGEADAAELPLLAQRAENEYVGMNCGIMDQFISANGREGSAVLLDCSTLEYEYAPLDIDDYNIVIANTNVKHELVDSVYNDRRKECSEALEDLRKAVPGLECLCALSPAKFEDCKDVIRSDVAKKRARHAVTEEARTIEASDALREGDMERFGRIMYESHDSLRDDFEVSCDELDFLVEYARDLDGVIGARMTGGGFGGCTVNIVENESVQDFIDGAGALYKSEFGREASFYVAEAGDGAKLIH